MAKQTFTTGQVLTAAQMNSLQANDYNWTVDTKTDSYVLVAGDAGKRIVMNAATAKTITVNTSIFTAGDTVWIHNINTGTCTVTAGTATVNTAGSLALAQWEGGALYFTSASTAIFFRGGGANYGVATGGTSSSITVGGQNYTLLTFTSTGTLTVTKAGLFDVQIHPGGGGGSSGQAGQNRGGGGGGGGGILTTTVYLTANQTVTVGGGGTGAVNDASPGVIGSASSVGTVATMAGGGGSGLYLNASNGGCGGGGWGLLSGVFTNVGGTALLGTDHGKNGGDGVNEDAGGGGGGIGAIGSNAVTSTGGAGGAGIDVSTFIGGSALFKGAGGGGGGATGGSGGSSIGGNGGGTGVNGVAASANTASGGGGGGRGSTDGGNGGSGIVLVRFRS